MGFLGLLQSSAVDALPGGPHVLMCFADTKVLRLAAGGVLGWTSCQQPAPACRAVDGAGAPELPSRKRVREEDDTYAAAKQASQAKKQAKQQTYSAKPMRAPKADPTTQEARGITKDIVKNRGLTPHRSKANKNPRKKHRNKFEKALVRRKGQVQEARAGTAGGYGGEQTGIKSNVTRGVKF